MKTNNIYRFEFSNRKFTILAQCNDFNEASLLKVIDSQDGVLDFDGLDSLIGEANVRFLIHTSQEVAWHIRQMRRFKVVEVNK